MRESIDNVLVEIRDAEAAAEQLVKDAAQAGRDAVLGAQADADKRYADTVAQCKQQRKDALNEAEEQARDRRAAILRKGAEAAQDLIDNNNSKIEDAADEVVARLVEKYKPQL